MECHDKCMEGRERKMEMEALAFKTEKGRWTGRLLFEEFLMGSMCKFQGNFTAAECIES